jgi:mannose-6-phosphate isomerase-like protein (cupin superfamily)
MKLALSRRAVIPILGLPALLLVVAGVAVASHRPAAGLLVDGTTANVVNFNDERIKLRTQGSIRFRQAHVVRVDNPLTSGWHTHPGAEILAVAEGSITITESDCRQVTLGANQAYIAPPNVPFDVATSPTVDFTVTHVLPMPPGPGSAVPSQPVDSPC